MVVLDLQWVLELLPQAHTLRFLDARLDGPMVIKKPTIIVAEVIAVVAFGLTVFNLVEATR